MMIENERLKEELTTIQSNYYAQVLIIADLKKRIEGTIPFLTITENVRLQQEVADLKKQLEPKSCDGCMYQHSMDDDCFRCARYHQDRYEPKENK